MDTLYTFQWNHNSCSFVSVVKYCNVVQVTTISNSLNRVEERFKTSPELIKVPHDLETLTTNIATFGSQMQDLVGTVAQLKEASGKLSLTTDTLQSNVSSIRVSV